MSSFANKQQNPKKILLGQLGSFGDCLYATAVARQIKVDFPNCHLTWAIGSPYRSILKNNPHVDDVWVFPLSERNGLLTHWQEFKEEALERKKKGDFDKVFLTQVMPGNIKNYDGTLRSSIFRGYQYPITVSVSPIVQLSQSEIENVCRFSDHHKLSSYELVVLFECSPKSGQSFVNKGYALKVAENLVASVPGLTIILSSNESFQSTHCQIIDGSSLSFRENLKLLDYCDFLIGCSSGISWLATSENAKKMPMVQLLEKDKFMYASFTHDFKLQKINSSHIIEMTNCTTNELVDCVMKLITDGIDSARNQYGQKIPVKFGFYWQSVMELLFERQFKDFFCSTHVTCKRWGYRFNFFLSFLLPFCKILFRFLKPVFPTKHTK